eukprot:jgi/Ulvmu1/249/UM001_0253.1
MSARFVLLAGCLGRKLHDEFKSRGAIFLSNGNGTVCKPLLACAGLPILNHWLKQIEDCPRLQNKVWIVVNKEHLPLYHDWARKNQFPCDKLICNGVSASDDYLPGDAKVLSMAVPEGSQDWVFCARADYVFEPEQSLRHFVESAFISQRLTIAMTRPSANAMEAGLQLQTSQDSDGLRGDSFMSNVLIKAGNTLKVDSCSLSSQPGCEWVSAPLWAIPPDVYDHLSLGTSSDCWRSLEKCIAAYNVDHPLTGFKFGPIFSLRSLKQVLFTDQFFNHLARRRAEVHAELNQAIPAPRCSVGPEVLLGTAKSEVDLAELARSALAVDLQKELERFSLDEETALITLSQVAGCDLTLPKRFVKAPEWSYQTRRPQHPCYTTSNASYGLKNPKPADMPLAWRGIKGDFTKHSEGAVRDKGLRCFTTMSKVHKRFDEYTHFR